MGALPSGLVTFCFTDIEASTQLNQHLGERFGALIAEHDALIRRAVAGRDGVVVKSLGDGLFLAFADSRQAVLACREAQRALTSHSWPDGVTVRVRMGLHTGEALPHGGDYTAVAVHQAERVSGAAHGGQILLSEATVRAAGHLPAGLALRALGSFRLKGFAEPTRLFQLEAEDLERRFPAARAVPAAAHNVPTLLPSFVGREAEIQSLGRLLDQQRLVSVVGPGGVGKTRLVLEFARLRAERFRDGVWVALLADTEDSSDVSLRVADALGVRDQSGSTIEQTLVDWLVDRDVLLVIDNCEHVAEEVAGLVDRLLSSCGALRLLATSREPLRVPGERVWRIPPLGMPDSDDQDLRTWKTASAALLFADRARDATPGFPLDDTTLPVVAQLCRDLDGLPLALELAAARLRHLTLMQLAGRLSDRLRLLTGGPRTAHSRHQTIRALLEWSYEPLGEPERLLFRRVAVFRGSFSLEAAEALCGRGQPGSDALDVLDGLGDLVDRSLVTLTELPDGEPGYRLLVLVREYGRALLAETGELAAMRARHLAWVLDESRSLPHRPLERSFAEEERPRFRRIADDVRAALDYAIECGDAHAACILGGRFGRYAFAEGRWREGRDWAVRALELPADEPELRAWLLYRAGLLSICLGDADGSEAYGTEMLELGRIQASGDIVASALHVLADAASVRGSLDLARERYAEAARATVHPAHGWILERSLGEIAALKGDWGTAADIYRRVLAAFERLGDSFEWVRTAIYLAALLVRDGQVAEAASLTDPVAAQAQSFGVATFEIEILALGATISARRGRPQAAARLLGAATKVGRDLGFPLERALGDCPMLQTEVRRCIGQLREQLGNQGFEAGLSQGASLSPTEAVALRSGG
jgi:predicted ATPase/class 3 adenylate cyclase